MILINLSVCRCYQTADLSQFLLHRLGRCLKLFVSTESTSCHEFASQFGLDIFLFAKNTQTIANTESVYLNEAGTGHWSPAEPAKRGR